MTKKSMAPPSAQTVQASKTRVTQVRDPGDIISMIPYLVGFTPEESVVLISLEGPRQRFGPCLRMDLVRDLDDVEMQVGYLLEVIERHEFGPLVIAAFASATGLADVVVGELLGRLRELGIPVKEALRADGRRWWSYTCDDPGCCACDGTPYDVDTSRMAAEAVLSGLAKAQSRDALRARVGPAVGDERQQVALCCVSPLPGGPHRADDVAARLEAALGAPDELVPTEVAALATAVQTLGIRDQVWVAMTRNDAERHFRLWSRVLGLCPDPLLPAVGSLAAFAAWLSGQGVLASHAVDRVAGVDPAYSMMLLIRSLLDMAINPQVWDEMMATPGWGDEDAALC